MKRLFILALCLTLQPLLQAQPATSAVSPATDTNNTSGVEYVVVGRAANARQWGRVVTGTNSAGQTVVRTNVSYTEVGANLCVQDAAGNWLNSDGSLAIVADGAASGNSPLAVHFAGDANAAGGTVTLTAPDGKVFVSKVYGITFYDPSVGTVGTNVLLAPLQNSQGKLVGNNHIWYPNAFAGLNADLWYTFSPSRLEQDVVLHEAPPSPAACGLNPQTARLQIWTEWFNPPEPRKIAGEDGAITHDAYLDFGNMVMGPGAALFTQGQADPAPVESGTIYKHWQQTQQRDWLIEEIPFQKIANVLQALPLHASVGKPGRSLYKDIAASQPLRPKAGAGLGTPIQVAKSFARQPGLVLDYSLVSSSDNFTFQSDTTYYVSNTVTMGGSNTTFEGGTILKYAANAGLIVNSPVTWLGSGYRPVVMTAKDDNTMGDAISGSTGNPGTNYYSAAALCFNGSVANVNLILHNLRVLNASIAVVVIGATNHLLDNVQMVNCGDGLVAINTRFSLWNGLMCNVVTNFTGTNSTGDVEHLTVDTASWLNDGQTLNLTNCLLVAVANGGTGMASSNQVDSVPSRSGVFQTVGDASHYLTNSTYLNAGTTGINPTLAAALGQMTTFPPVVYSNTTITAATNLGIQALRDSETPGPTLGYHYDPLDWVFGGTKINSNITFTAGTGVGWFNAASKGYGIYMANTMIAYFQGAATAPVWWARANTVQEGGSGTVWPGAGTVGGLVGEDNQYNTNVSLSPQANLFFTHCSILGFGDGGGINHFRDDYGYLIVNAEHSEIHGGCLGGYVLSCYFTNCLIDRVLLAQVQGWPGNAFICTNCTFHGGYLDLNVNHTPIPIAVRDCTFDGDTLSVTSYAANSNYANYDYNAFTNTAGKFPIGGTHDQIVPGGFNWESSWFGNFYLPTNSPLIKAGDVTANVVGLYHFTTQTNQVIEGTNMVSIGFHYVATDSNGNPLETYWQGIPDYLADTNGELGTWEMYYFGHLGLDPNASFDGLGNTVLYDYQNGLVPNNLSFQICFTNQYVNRTNAPLSLAIQSGLPYYWAVLLDNTNFAGASWTPYTSSNITANLGTNQGWHTVWVGLSAGSQQAWNAVRLDLDLTAPILVVTNATNVTIPMIQLQGYANEELAWLTYDLNNANGSISNQPGFMTGAIFDTNSFTYTNNSFKCFDLMLASGANTVTLHAADLAGNSTNFAVSFNLNYSNKLAPVVQLWWPQNGTQISGSSFTLRGTVDDPTVTLSAQITDSNGDTNVLVILG